MQVAQEVQETLVKEISKNKNYAFLVYHLLTTKKYMNNISRYFTHL